MPKLAVKGFRLAEEVKRRTIHRQPGRSRVPPLPAYDGQPLDAFIAGLNIYSDDNSHLARHTPDTELDLHYVEDGVILVGDGLDGVVITSDGMIIDDTRIFTTEQCRHLIGREIDIAGELATPVYPATDGTWNNYYHWLIALAKLGVVAPSFLDTTQVIMPDFATRFGGTRLASMLADSLALGGVARAAVSLPVGAYRAPLVYVSTTRPRRTDDLLHLQPMTDLFDTIRGKVAGSATGRRRLLVVRESRINPRIPPQTQDDIWAVTRATGFEKIVFEHLSFREQVEAVASAEMMVAPHGAGLVNALFADSTLRILELNSDLDGNGKLRTCFYLCSELRKQPYMFLDGSVGDFSTDRLEAAVARLASEPAKAATLPVHAQRIVTPSALSTSPAR